MNAAVNVTWNIPIGISVTKIWKNFKSQPTHEFYEYFY